MFKALSLSAAIAAVAAATMAPAPADARGYYEPAAYYGGGGDYYQPAGWNGDHHRYRGDRHYRGDRYRGDRYYGGRHNGYRGRGRCRDKGNGGTVIGAIAGGLLGNQVAGNGDRTLGTIIGAGGGAVAGRLIDRDC